MTLLTTIHRCQVWGTSAFLLQQSLLLAPRGAALRLLLFFFHWSALPRFHSFNGSTPKESHEDF